MVDDLKVAGYLAYKTIVRGRKATNALMIFIMSLAFINLVFISSILNGVVATIDRQLQTNLVSNIVVEPQEKPVKKDLISRAQELRREIERLAGVTATARRYKLAATISFDKERNGKFIRHGAQIMGVEPENERLFSEIASKMVSGRYLDGLGSGDIILGFDLAGGPGTSSTIDNLEGATVGRKVEVTFGNGVSREYTVRGIFKTSFTVVDHEAFITAREAESVLDTYDSASQILVKLAAPGTEESRMAEVQRLAPDLKVRPWTEYSGMFSGVSSTVNTITAVISAIGLLVAAVTIFIVIFVSVTHKRRQIGILKAIGLRPRVIVISYVLQALFFAVSGVIIGTLAVLLLLVPYFSAHPLDLPIGASGLTLDPARFRGDILMLIGASIVAGLLPSWQGSRENILKAIWGD